MLITSEQVRGARAILKMTIAELAEVSGVGAATLKRVESGFGIPSAHSKTLDSIERALLAKGIEFVGTPDDRPGVRFNAAFNRTDPQQV